MVVGEDPAQGPLVVPPPLRPGDAVAVVSPSSVPSAAARLERGLVALRAWGFEPVVGEATRAGDSSVAARAAELNAAFIDPRIRAVFCTIGGYTSIEVLDVVNWSALRADPKAVIGYSDLTSVLSAAMVHAGLQVFHGPTVLPEIAEYPAPLDHTARHLLRALTTRGAWEWEMPYEATDEYLDWGTADVRARVQTPVAGWSWSRGAGVIEGVVVGGNLDTLCSLAGTPHFPLGIAAPQRRILVLETIDDNVARTVQRLTQLRMAGLLGAAAILVGRRFRGSVDLAACLERVLLEDVHEPPLIVSDVDLGHTDPMVTVPLGGTLRLDASARTVEVWHR